MFCFSAARVPRYCDCCASPCRFSHRGSGLKTSLGAGIVAELVAVRPLSDVIACQGPLSSAMVGGSNPQWPQELGAARSPDSCACAAIGAGQLWGEITITGCKFIAEKDAGGTLILVLDAIQAFDKRRVAPYTLRKSRRRRRRVADLATLAYTRVYAWILEDPTWCPDPRSYRHPSGCQNWIPLSPSPRPKIPRKRPAVAVEDEFSGIRQLNFPAGKKRDCLKPICNGCSLMRDVLGLSAGHLEKRFVGATDL